MKARGGVEIQSIELPVEAPVAKNKAAFTGLCHYILASRPNGDWNSDFEMELLRDLLLENEVTIGEAYQAFKGAYSDRFTPASGVEWRHLWSYIEEARLGSERKLYSYAEMLNICDRENIDTDHFEPVEISGTGKIKGWKRK